MRRGDWKERRTGDNSLEQKKGNENGKGKRRAQESEKRGEMEIKNNSEMKKTTI